MNAPEVLMSKDNIQPMVGIQAFDLEFYQKNEISRSNPLVGLGAGDSRLYLDVLSEELKEEIFNHLDCEVGWNIMTHKGGAVPRLISIQGDIEHDVCFPLYRHPADEQPSTIPFTPFARKCRDEVSEILGQRFNHALIQKYRSGKDNISEHADKSLDIARGTAIVNLSIGCTRVMILRSKPDHPDTLIGEDKDEDGPGRGKIVQKITLPPNSLFVLGWQTNLLFTHSIKADKRMPQEKRPDERLYNEQRISLTFRNIATFISPTGIIFGQGAKKKAPTVDLRPMPDFTNHSVLGTEEEEKKKAEQTEECIKLLHAFSVENRSALFDWDQYYGEGFDVINFQVIN